MQYRFLGTTNIQASVIGLGTSKRIAENVQAGTVILSENEMQLMDQLFKSIV
jgi:aryl-alcohol dehydrogenase-like predicted oxidoreductase